jgi:predicted RNA-binding Zn ribbon-like protein
MPVMPESDNRGLIESKAAPTKQFPRSWQQDLSEFVAAVISVKDQPLLVKIADQSSYPVGVRVAAVQGLNDQPSLVKIADQGSYPDVVRVAAVQGLNQQPSLAVLVDHICADQSNYSEVVRVAALGQLVANLTEESAKLIARFSQNIPKLVSEALLVKLIRENLIDRSRIAAELIRELFRRRETESLDAILTHEHFESLSTREGLLAAIGAVVEASEYLDQATQARSFLCSFASSAVPLACDGRIERVRVYLSPADMHTLFCWSFEPCARVYSDSEEREWFRHALALLEQCKQAYMDPSLQEARLSRENGLRDAARLAGRCSER